MHYISCTFSDLLEAINEEYLPCTVYVDLEKASLKTYDIGETVGRRGLIRLPYAEELYTENRALGDYIQETGISIPHRMSARRYLRQNGLFFDFYSFYNAEVKLRLKEWFEERKLQIVFNA